MALLDEVQKRRTFAIISHPDAGKTTLTEKLLLYGGAIHLAGAVRGKKNQKATTSDWMELEKQRGISVSASVLQFEYAGHQVNLLDTPGHKDFSEDTYRTLTAADAAVMLLDSAKGVEPQTIKLFEVCRMRGIPIFSFFNKWDRPSREPLELMDELERVLGIRSCPMTWPIGSGDRFKGVYDRFKREILTFQTEGEANQTGRLAPVAVTGLDDPKFLELIGGDTEVLDQLRSELELVEVAGDPLDMDRVLKGQLSPIFSGSAMNNFGVERFLQTFLEMAPCPAPRIVPYGESDSLIINPEDANFSGFVFKIQANMDPNHRDRVAFMRVCSGKFERGMQVTHVRLEKEIKLSMPVNFFGQERVVIDQAYPGDIVGLVDTTGSLRIGDTLCAGPKAFEYPGIPSFTPEHFAGISIRDPMKRKQLEKGLEQLAEEGVVQVYQQAGFSGRDPILGGVGALQFEVLQFRLKAEYGVDTKVERLGFEHARWIVGEGFQPSDFERRGDAKAVIDRDGQPVVLFASAWALKWSQDNYKSLQFLKTAPVLRRVKKKR